MASSKSCRKQYQMKQEKLRKRQEFIEKQIQEINKSVSEESDVDKIDRYLQRRERYSKIIDNIDNELINIGFELEAGDKADEVLINLDDANNIHSYRKRKKRVNYDESVSDIDSPSNHTLRNEEASFDKSKTEKSVQCDVCYKYFSKLANVRRHKIKIHACKINKIIGDFKCHVCSALFSNPANLRRHLKLFHNQEASIYECHHCGEKFAAKKQILNHVITAHKDLCGIGEPGYVCSSCGQAYYTRFQLCRHVKKNCSVRCDDELKEILPDDLNYKILSAVRISQSQDEYYWLKAKIELLAKEEQQIHEWIKKFETRNNIEYRKASIRRNRNEDKNVVVRFRCSRNTQPKKGKGASKKHTSCTAMLTVKIETGDDTEDGLSKYIVVLRHTHNHPLSGPGAVGYLKPLPEVERKFIELFEKGYRPFEARKIFTQELVDRREDLLTDTRVCPSTSWIYKTYYNNGGAKVYKKSKRGGGNSINILAQAVSIINEPDPVYEGCVRL